MAASPTDHVHHPTDDDHRAGVDAALAALRDAGGRITAGRRAIVTAVLAGDDHHVTADELASHLQRDNPDMAVSTIYRTLDALEELGIVVRIDLGQGRAVYHPVDHVHHHLVCRVCGRVDELAPGVVTPFLREVSGQSGFDVAGEPLTLHGRCAGCSG